MNFGLLKSHSSPPPRFYTSDPLGSLFLNRGSVARIQPDATPPLNRLHPQTPGRVCVPTPTGVGAATAGSIAQTGGLGEAAST